jgi:hypothetical protein
MKRRLLAAIVVALAMTLLPAHDTSVRAQPVASIALPPPRGTVQLYPGCNNIALSFPDGTDRQTVVQAVTPAGVVEAMWRHNAAQNKFEGFSPAAPQASDLLTVNLWDAVWLCLAAAPALPPPPPAPAAPTPTPVPPPTPTAMPTVNPSQETIVFAGQGYKDTPSFDVVITPFAINWTTQSDSPEYAGFSFYVYPEGETVGSICQASFDGVGSDSTVCHAPAGRYWIKVLAANLSSWSIEVTEPPTTLTLPATFSGQGYKDTDTFHVDAQSFTVAWMTQSDSPEHAGFSFYVYREGETVGSVCHASFDGVGSDSTVCHASPGDLYMVVLTANLNSWRVEITQ